MRTLTLVMAESVRGPTASASGRASLPGGSDKRLLSICKSIVIEPSSATSGMAVTRTPRFSIVDCEVAEATVARGLPPAGDDGAAFAELDRGRLTLQRGQPHTGIGLPLTLLLELTHQRQH